MNSPIENLEEIEAAFLLNKQDNYVISQLLTRLQSYENLPVINCRVPPVFYTFFNFFKLTIYRI